MSTLEIQQFGIAFGSERLFSQVHLSLRGGNIYFLTGASGLGKSTLLACIAQLQTQYEGEILLNARNIRSLSRLERLDVGYVSQSFDLFPHLSVLQNCVEPQRVVLKRERAQATENARRWLQELGIEEKAAQFPGQLSGGQKQRVAIARTLSMGSRVLLMDEPTSALDGASISAFVAILQQLKQEGLLLLLVSHDLNFAQSCADEIFLLEGRQVRKA